MTLLNKYIFILHQIIGCSICLFQHLIGFHNTFAHRFWHSLSRDMLTNPDVSGPPAEIWKIIPFCYVYFWFEVQFKDSRTFSRFFDVAVLQKIQIAIINWPFNYLEMGDNIDRKYCNQPKILRHSKIKFLHVLRPHESKSVEKRRF